MRFQGPGKTRYLGRRDQIRLLMMVAMTGFVVIAIQYAARPSTWYWLTGLPDPEAAGAQSPAPGISFAPDREPVDDLPPGVVRINKPEPQRSRAAKSETPVPTTTGELAVGGELAVAPDKIALIQNNRVGIRDSERALYYELLARTRDTPLSTLESAGRKDLAFTVMMTESEKHLCELVTIKGELRGLRKLPASPNESGVEDVWEAWIFNRDSGKSPFVMRCTSIPEGIQTGMELPSGIIVSVSGYFFKRYGYPAQEFRLHTAPLILARTLRWYRPESATKSNDRGIIPYVLSFAGLLIGAISFTLWRFRISDREFEQQHLKRLTAASPEAIAALETLPVIDVGTSLQHLAESYADDEAIDDSTDDEDDLDTSASDEVV